MPLANPYADAYLAPLVTQAREDQAASEIAMLGAFPVEWTQRLTVLRAYVITCTESMKAPDDTFSAKLSAYRREFDAALPQARAAQAAVDAGTTPGGSSVFSVALERS